MEEFIMLLPDILLYIVLGFVFVRSYKFTRISKIPNDYQHTLTEALICGFILKNLLSIIPISLGRYWDTIGMVIASILGGFAAAKIIDCKYSDKLRRILRIRQTFNNNIWADLCDKEGTTYVSIEDKVNHVVTDGVLVLYESFERQPLIQLAEFRQARDDEMINDFSNEPERTILIDTSKYDDIVITYEKNSSKTKRWRKTDVRDK